MYTQLIMNPKPLSRFLLLLLVFNLFHQIDYAQSGGVVGQSGSTLVGAQKAYDPQILPPSPEAFSFTRYGNLPVGLISGTAQYNLPVYTIKSGALAHNMGLNYATNGVKVDEVAGREGTGWVLKTGGVIRRTVLGRPDENGTRTFFHGTAGDNAAFYDFVRQASYSAYDFQPDEYFFDVDGLSGKFLKGEDGKFKQLSASANKIEQYGYGFLITAANGTKYYFEAGDVTLGYNENESYEIGQEPIPATTSWFLTKIKSPTGDSIKFNYSSLLPSGNVKYYTGITQSYATYLDPDLTYQYIGAFGGYMSGYACMVPSPFGVHTKVNISEYSGGYLTSIDFNGGKIKLIYSARQDMIDEVKLDTIKVIRDTDNKLIKCYALGYTYSSAQQGVYETQVAWGNLQNLHPDLRKRLFLSSFSEVSADLSQNNSYEFTYDDINGLPPRLAFAQDAYGQFNGKMNDYLFPNNTWVDLLIGGNRFGGDRSFSFSHAKKGVLTKIKYPTGGYSTFDYEPHTIKYYTATRLQRDSLVVAMNPTTMMNQTVETDTFVNEGNRTLRLKVYCDWEGEPAEFFPDAYFAMFSFIDINSGNCVYRCEQQVQPGYNNIDGTLEWRLPAGTYKVRIKASMPNLRILGVLEKEYLVVDTSENAGIGGLRVKSVTDFTSDNKESSRREFIYASWEDPTTSSGVGLYLNSINANFTSAIRTLGSNAGGYVDQNGQNTVYCGYTTINSSSLTSLYSTENGTVLYEKVLELNHASNGINNGGTEYTYEIENKFQAIPMAYGNPANVWDFSPILMEGVPFNNNDFRNGLLLNSKTFTYQQKFGTRSFLQETSNYYSLDQGIYSVDTLFAVREVMRRDRVPSWRYFYDYDINQYYRYYGWIHLDSTVERAYTNGIPALKFKKNFTYSNKNFLPKTESSLNSRNELTTTTYSYPPDKAQPIGQPANIYNAMADANMVDAKVESIYSNGSELAKERINFSTFNSHFLPASIEKSFKGLTLENEVSFDQYDAKGRLLQYTAKNGVKSTFIWDYNQQYPIAEIKNANADQIAYTSFEADGLGGWTMSPGGTISNTGGITGNKAFSGVLNKTVPAGNYTVTVWSIYYANVLVNGVAGTPGRRVGMFELREWKLNNVSSVQVVADGIDEVRLYPQGAPMTTYTYDPLIGLTSQCDVNNRITYYQYDGFNRLKTIRDEEKNVLKTMDYQYQKPYNQ